MTATSRAAPAASKPGGSWRQRPGEAGDELFEIVEAVEAWRSRHAWSQDDVVEFQQLIVVGNGLLIVDVEGDTAKPAGAQRFDQGIAVDDPGVRHVDDAGTWLDLLKF